MELQNLAKEIDAELVGDSHQVINGFSSNVQDENKILFISSKKHIPEKYHQYGAILTSYELSELFKNCNLLLSENPKLSFSFLTKLFTTESSEPKIDNNNSHKNLMLGKNITLGKNIKFGSNVVINDGVKIGDNSVIGHNVVIHRDCVIKKNVVIDSGTIIGSEGFGNILDRNKKWSHICHAGKVIIDDNVLIGSNCCIDRGTIEDTIISSGVIMDNLVHIAHNVSIGENTAIAAKVGIAGSCVIGKRNMIGGMVGIVDHITTVDDVIISATSTVNKDIKKPGLYTGILPILEHANWKRIAFWISKLDKIAKSITLKK